VGLKRLAEDARSSALPPMATVKDARKLLTDRACKSGFGERGNPMVVLQARRSAIRSVGPRVR